MEDRRRRLLTYFIRNKKPLKTNSTLIKVIQRDGKHLGASFKGSIGRLS